MMTTIKCLPIIVLEDSDEDFETVQTAVREAGLTAEIRRATTGEECLELLRGADAIRPAVVLMDLNTHGTDGRETLRVIKVDPELKAYPVVVFSISTDPRDLSYCYAAGANAYHVKPLRYPDHLQILIDLLSYWLGRVSQHGPNGTNR